MICRWVSISELVAVIASRKSVVWWRRYSRAELLLAKRLQREGHAHALRRHLPHSLRLVRAPGDRLAARGRHHLPGAHRARDGGVVVHAPRLVSGTRHRVRVGRRCTRWQHQSGAGVRAAAQLVPRDQRSRTDSEAQVHRGEKDASGSRWVAVSRGGLRWVAVGRGGSWPPETRVTIATSSHELVSLCGTKCNLVF